ncbi:HET-domain-containing protein [Alternaria alternata]|uniref:HET-domain-containing protein n=1 Tax=Alternaria alternata TaxID=5599 RepID=A0A177DL06_ALTAL|nr:HET-domain-containing protein [Alternaria alternata]OAG19712.1 HET-domain-containing protein [Alternaria alternata]
MNTLYPTRLSESEIRLLHILPSESTESPVSCELRQYEIDDIPAYEALSYCWGDSAERREIVCNGATHWVTMNLRDALVRLRLTNEARIVWADALCIAQSDEEEKSSQVRRMGSIFHCAKRVVVWLGHVEKEYALDIKRVFDSLICVKAFKGDPEHHFSDWRIPDIAAVFGGSLPWNALNHFFNTPWFRRIWCIQEIRLASDSMFYWGAEELSRYVPVRLAGWTVDRCQGEIQHSPYAIFEQFAYYMNGPFRDDKCSLLSALRTYRKWEATDPRDKIYGILGLMELGEERHIIRIDYDKSVQDVYHDLATAVIGWTGDLALFAHVHHGAHYDGDPTYKSWIPQWDQTVHVPIFPIGTFLYPSTLPSGTYHTISPPVGTAQHYDRPLTVSGLTHQTYWSEKVSAGSPLGRDMSPVMMSMARTLTTGVVSQDDTLYECATEDDIAAYFQSFLAYIRLLHSIANNESEGGLTTQNLSEYDDSWKLFEDIMGNCCYRRKFFRTKNGTLGLGPACLKENDMIVVLEGAYNPCALRPKGDTYLLLGDVYMDEIRHGELIKEIEEGRKERQYFCLD